MSCKQVTCDGHFEFEFIKDLAEGLTGIYILQFVIFNLFFLPRGSVYAFFSQDFSSPGLLKIRHFSLVCRCGLLNLANIKVYKYKEKKLKAVQSAAIPLSHGWFWSHFRLVTIVTHAWKNKTKANAYYFQMQTAFLENLYHLLNNFEVKLKPDVIFTHTFS